jgi:putative photosynthetic complex assembly protein
MSDPFDNKPFPRAPLIGAACLLGGILIATFLVTLTGIGRSHRPDAPIVAQIALQFTDQSDGSIRVVDANDHQLIDTVAPGTNGFLRGTLRGLARERKRESAGAIEPFILASHSDGRLTLYDPATQRRVDLESFGPTNEEVFAHLLKRGSSEAQIALAPPEPSSAPSGALKSAHNASNPL